MQMGNIAGSQATGAVAVAQRQRAQPAGLEPASDPKARGAKCPARVLLVFADRAGSACADPGLARLRCSGAADQRNIPVLTRAARFGLVGDTNCWDLEHVACWDWH